MTSCRGCARALRPDAITPDIGSDIRCCERAARASSRRRADCRRACAPDWRRGRSCGRGARRARACASHSARGRRLPRFHLGSRAVPTTSYWLSEPHEPLPRVELDGTPDVAVVGGGITGCSCALALAEAGLRVRLYDEREIAGGASGRNGGFALRGGAAPYPVMVESIGRERAARALALDGARGRQTSLRLQVTHSDRPEAFVSPQTTRKRASSQAEYDALRADGFEVEWLDELRAATRGTLPGSDLPPSRRRPPAGAARPQGRSACGRGRRRDSRAHARATAADTGAEVVVVATDGYPSGLLGPLEGLIVPTRGQVIATEPVRRALLRDPALRAPRLRLLAPDTRRARRRGRIPRRLAPGRVHRGGARLRLASRKRSSVSSPRWSAARSGSIIAGRGSSGWSSTSCRSSAAVPEQRRRLGRRRVLGPRQRARLCVRTTRRSSNSRRP